MLNLALVLVLLKQLTIVATFVKIVWELHGTLKIIVSDKDPISHVIFRRI